MDTSPEYIKMCEKAEEIQEIQPAPHYSKESFYHFDEDDISIRIWLPRQDQLQEILLNHYEQDPVFAIALNKTILLLGRFKDFVWSLTSDIFHGSLEQLWLAFVMKEKYNKTWTDGDWA